MGLWQEEPLRGSSRESEPLLGEYNGLVLVLRVIDEATFVQPIRRVPIDSLPCTGQAMFFPRREVENGQYRFVNLRFVVTHRSATVRAQKMMRLLRSVVKVSQFRASRTPAQPDPLPSNDKIERRGAAPTRNEGSLSQSSTPPWLTGDATRDRSNRLLGLQRRLRALPGLEFFSEHPAQRGFVDWRGTRSLTQRLIDQGLISSTL
jgi:hypothetical protein